MTLHDYQRVAAQWILDHPRAGLFLEPGLGKTLTTIYALEALRLTGEVERVLLVAPLRVARDTWPAELEKWATLHDMSYAVAVGTPAKRRAALRAGADVTVVSISNLDWVLDEHHGAPLPYDTLVVDELSLFKSPRAQRFKALKRHLPKFGRIITLTGTPAPNSLLDLWPQMFVTDQGESLGTRIGQYRNAYFTPDKRRGHVVFSYALNPGADKRIYERVGKTAISMRSVDHLDLPKRTNNHVKIRMSQKLQDEYKRFMRDQVLLTEEGEVTAQNAAALAGKLQQFAGGAIYDEDGEVIHVHGEKLDALRGIVEELQGSPVIVFYSYKHELARIREAFPAAETYGDDTMQRWNAGEIPMLCLHPASAGHGLNLQHGGHTAVWFGLTWSLELYQQANARLDRQGQTHPVVIHHLVTAGTVDERIIDVLGRKGAGQGALLDAVRAEVARV